MKKYLKKVSSIILALTIIFTMNYTPIFAADIHEDITVHPNVVAECGSYATHDMLSAGWGSIYDVDKGKYVVVSGACFQCTRCHLVIVCQNEPNSGIPCGTWTTYQPGESLTSQYTVIYQNASNIKYESTPSIYGCTFRYTPY